jgi:hypothetical protein
MSAVDPFTVFVKARGRACPAERRKPEFARRVNWH